MGHSSPVFPFFCPKKLSACDGWSHSSQSETMRVINWRHHAFAARMPEQKGRRNLGQQNMLNTNWSTIWSHLMSPYPTACGYKCALLLMPLLIGIPTICSWSLLTENASPEELIHMCSTPPWRMTTCWTSWQERGHTGDQGRCDPCHCGSTVHNQGESKQKPLQFYMFPKKKANKTMWSGTTRTRFHPRGPGSPAWRSNICTELWRIRRNQP